MLTYTPPRMDTAPATNEKPWMLLLLCFVWLWPGIFGHAPWKPDEGYVAGVVQSMLEDGHWLVPTIVNVPYLDSSPLYYWVAAGFAWLTSPILPLADGMRLATPFFMVFALWFVGLAGRDLLGRRYGRSVAMLLLGSLGLMTFGHAASPDIATFCGFALVLWSLSLSRSRGWLAGLLFGIATGMLALSASMLELGLAWIIALLLFAFKAWRTPEHGKALAVALTVGLPLALAWPLALTEVDPALASYWWRHRALGTFQGFGRTAFLHDFGYYLQIFPWFAMPLWPLSLWTLWRRRAALSSPALQLPMLFFVVLAVMMTLSPVQAQELALPWLVPLAVLAAAELDTLKRGAAACFNWFGLMTFGLIAAFIWLGWVALNFGWPARLAERAAFFAPTYKAELNLPMLLVACAATLVWLWAVTRRNLEGRKASTNWAAGVTLIWALAASLWLPWIDIQKSYAPLISQLRPAAPTDSCMVTDAGLSFIALARYHGGLILHPDSGAHADCRYSLVMRYRDSDRPANWVWAGQRPGDRKEFYYLIRR